MPIATPYKHSPHHSFPNLAIFHLGEKFFQNFASLFAPAASKKKHSSSHALRNFCEFTALKPLKPLPFLGNKEPKYLQVNTSTAPSSRRMIKPAESLKKPLALNG